MHSAHRYLLLILGLSLAVIGLAYCIDPNLLLARYELAAESSSEDNMYRGAYGGLFLTLGTAIAFGFLSASFRQPATLIALLFMSGFALGRIASIIAVGMPHGQIMNLLVVELLSSAMLTWFLLEPSRRGVGTTGRNTTDKALNTPG